MTNIPPISDYNRKYQEYLEAKAAANLMRPCGFAADLHAKDGDRIWLRIEEDGKLRLGRSFATGWEAVMIPHEALPAVHEAVGRLLGIPIITPF